VRISAYGVVVTVKTEADIVPALAYLEFLRQLRLPLVIQREALAAR
jgi:hypothetical protein